MQRYFWFGAAACAMVFASYGYAATTQYDYASDLNSSYAQYDQQDDQSQSGRNDYSAHGSASDDSYYGQQPVDYSQMHQQGNAAAYSSGGQQQQFSTWQTQDHYREGYYSPDGLPIDSRQGQGSQYGQMSQAQTQWDQPMAWQAPDSQNTSAQQDHWQYQQPDSAWNSQYGYPQKDDGVYSDNGSVWDDCGNPCNAQPRCEPSCDDCYCLCCYYQPCYYDSWRCIEVPQTCKKKCVRYCPRYYDVQHCKYVPHYYTSTCCAYVPEYFYVDECITVPKWVCEKQCQYVPKYYYKRVSNCQ